MPEKTRSPRNKTLFLSPGERKKFASSLAYAEDPLSPAGVGNRIFHGDLFGIMPLFPPDCVDLAIADPPYNLDKNFHSMRFRKKSNEAYRAYLESFLPGLRRLLKPDASLYLCGDWNSCAAIQTALERAGFVIRNRITWQREKGRGSETNWKNSAEDIWFATVSNDYYFNADAVKLRRKVIAPYRENGVPKDWRETPDGNFRLTCASNFQGDITVPYWSMPENTEHPTQKPEKLMAKLILASSRENALVFDPFMGSGTAPVTAKKLGRRYCGIEIDREYCLLAAKRLALAETDKRIQGYRDGAFSERNE